MLRASASAAPAVNVQRQHYRRDSAASSSANEYDRMLPVTSAATSAASGGGGGGGKGRSFRRRFSLTLAGKARSLLGQLRSDGGCTHTHAGTHAHAQIHTHTHTRAHTHACKAIPTCFPATGVVRRRLCCLALKAKRAQAAASASLLLLPLLVVLELVVLEWALETCGSGGAACRSSLSKWE